MGSRHEEKKSFEARKKSATPLFKLLFCMQAGHFLSLSFFSLGRVPRLAPIVYYKKLQGEKIKNTLKAPTLSRMHFTLTTPLFTLIIFNTLIKLFTYSYLKLP